MFNLSPAVRNLLILNVALLALPTLLGTNALFSEMFGLHFFNARSFSPYQFVTYMFIHSGWMHLFFNMLGLVFFGPMLERMWGTGRFIVFYAVCGFGAGLLYLGINYFELSALIDAQRAFLLAPSPDALADFVSRFAKADARSYYALIKYYGEDPTSATLAAKAAEVVGYIADIRIEAPMIGASGAVFGILAAFGLLFPNTELLLFPLPVPVKAKYLIGFYAVTELWQGLQNSPGDNVAHYAHLGGMIFGWAMVLLWRKHSNHFY